MSRLILNDKKIFIGADEAGYGPNLGPLVIAATVWSAPKSVHETELCEVFARFSAPRPWTRGCAHLPLGDSKKLYQPSLGLASLEAGLLAMLRCQGLRHGNLADVLARHATAFHSRLADFDTIGTLPWYDSLEQVKVPGANLADEELSRLSSLVSQAMQESDIQLLATRAVVVDEAQFNSDVARLGSKGLLLSQATLGLVADLLTEFQSPAEVFCDRQGGRKNYMPILLDAMPEAWFQETSIGPARCSYHCVGERSIDLHFSVGGDSFPPTALASMLAKYLRERFMESFNAFWKRHLPGLEPTAGYPRDARRFLSQIEHSAQQLKLDPGDWWRNK